MIYINLMIRYLKYYKDNLQMPANTEAPMVELSLPLPMKNHMDISKCFYAHTFKVQVNYYVLRSKI